ncbi:uncharacterized protein SCHCODRAFT_02503767 [Schizophyllum commune H4-8]|uniref:Uncharacterized protein n=1 Tax=Schizophyllum commune (strain H4-8 / FGSC 9210) TaxID=578458 RepID=D8Q5H5_SCHCM|nr:uncharacterized protein SCHCODRAFT_02503767 [Schizophyllum commune H4-8]KAI5892183.1 hypothetical protein SCHCODRAFT_02503767 [Schizophyllum commune H4-8]
MVNKPTNKQRAVLGDPSRRQRHPGAQASSHSIGNHTSVGHVNATPNPPSHIPIECDSIGDVICSIRETSGLPHRPTYDIDSSDIAYSADLTPKMISQQRLLAARLKSLTLRGNNTEAKRQGQHTALLLMMRAWDLETLKVLRPGRTTVGFDTAVFDFAEKHTSPSKLKHLHLNMRFGYRAGLSKYLKSNSAANLETLRLKTNTDIQSILIEALVTGTQLPALRTLVLRIKKFAPSQLLDALEARHRSLGARDVLHTVEIAAPLAQATIDRARRMGITLTEVTW